MCVVVYLKIVVTVVREAIGSSGAGVTSCSEQPNVDVWNHAHIF